MSDEMDWDIDSLRNMVAELNRKGIEVKNKVANIFWQFRYQVTPYWEGENYNKVMEFVNEFVHSDGNGGYGTGFKEKTDLVAYDIPTRIEVFVNTQAEIGGGQPYNQNLISAYDAGNSDVWEVPLTVISKDGARRISTEKVQQFFVGTTDPSVKGEIELAKTKLNEYLAIFDAYEPYTKGNSAATIARAEVEDFIELFKERTDYMLGVVIDVAESEISGIEEVDIETIKIAHQGVEQQDGNDVPDNYDWEGDPCHLAPKDDDNNGGSTSGNKAPDGYNWDDDPCHLAPKDDDNNGGSTSGNKAPDGYNWDDDPCHLAPKNDDNNGGSTSGNKAPDNYDWKNDPCHFAPSNPDPRAPEGYNWDADPCHFTNSGNSSPRNDGNNGGSTSGNKAPDNYDWKNDPCHFAPSNPDSRAPEGYNWDADPCHFNS